MTEAEEGGKIPGFSPTLFCIPKFPTTTTWIEKTSCGYFSIKITKILHD